MLVIIYKNEFKVYILCYSSILWCIMWQHHVKSFDWCFHLREEGLSTLHAYRVSDTDEIFSRIPTEHLKLYTSLALKVLMPMKTIIHRSQLVKQTYAPTLLYHKQRAWNSSTYLNSIISAFKNSSRCETNLVYDISFIFLQLFLPFYWIFCTIKIESLIYEMQLEKQDDWYLSRKKHTMHLI